MEYKVDKTSTKVEFEKSDYIEAGIHENLELKKVEFRRSDEGNEFMAFYFEDETGSKLSHTEWNPGEDVSKVANQIARISQIVCGPIVREKGTDKILNPDSVTYIHPDNFIFTSSSFAEFCENTIKLLANKYVGKKVRVKCGYYKTNTKTGKSFISLPSYSKFAFIEPMTIPKDKSKIKILSIDKMTRPEVVKNNGKPSDLFETVADATKPKTGNPVDNLPWD